MGVLAWIVLGAVAGLLAERLMGTRTGMVVTTIVGIVGALLGGFLARALFHIDSLNSFFDISTWVTAIVGAALLLAIMHAVTGSRHRGTARL